MEVHFTPETEKKLQELAELSGHETADALVRDVVEGYFEELARTREMLDSRYDDLISGRIEPVPGDEFFESLRRREEERLKNEPPL